MCTGVSVTVVMSGKSIKERNYCETVISNRLPYRGGMCTGRMVDKKKKGRAKWRS